MKSIKTFIYTAASSLHSVYVKLGVTKNPLKRYHQHLTTIPSCDFKVFYHENASNIEDSAKKHFHSKCAGGENFFVDPSEIHRFYEGCGARPVAEDEWKTTVISKVAKEVNSDDDIVKRAKRKLERLEWQKNYKRKLSEKSYTVSEEEWNRILDNERKCYGPYSDFRIEFLEKTRKQLKEKEELKTKMLTLLIREEERKECPFLPPNRELTIEELSAEDNNTQSGMQKNSLEIALSDMKRRTSHLEVAVFETNQMVKSLFSKLDDILENPKRLRDEIQEEEDDRKKQKLEEGSVWKNIGELLSAFIREKTVKRGKIKCEEFLQNFATIAIKSSKWEDIKNHDLFRQERSSKEGKIARKEFRSYMYSKFNIVSDNKRSGTFYFKKIKMA